MVTYRPETDGIQPAVVKHYCTRSIAHLADFFKYEKAPSGEGAGYYDWSAGTIVTSD
jgi:hypothetical protein